MASPDRSLKHIYNLAEEARRTNLEIRKLDDEKKKADELQFYKDIAQRNMSTTQIEALRATYHARPKGQSLIYEDDQGQHRFGGSQQPPGNYQQGQSYQGQNRQGPYQQNQYQQHAQNSQDSKPSEPSRVLSQNPNRANAGPPQRGPRKFQPTPKDLPDRSTSKNPYINGSLTWNWGKDGSLCIKCGELGHMGKNCSSTPLPAWERSYLQMLIFGDNPQANFASVGYGEFDGNIQAYGVTAITPSASSSSGATTPSCLTPSVVSSYCEALPRSSSVSAIGFPYHSENQPPPRPHSVAAEAFYGEGSGPNKRPHIEIEEGPKNQEQAQPQQSQAFQPPNQPFVPPPAFEQPPPWQVPQFTQPQQPSMSQGPPFFMQPPQAQAPMGQPNQAQVLKKKGGKRTARKGEPQPLVGLYDKLGKYESPISIRQLLMANKVDMSFLDLVAWSPAVCKELKRLCTRIAKKKNPKPKVQQPMFVPTFGQVPQQFPAPWPQQQPVQYPQNMSQPVPQTMPQPIFQQAPVQPTQPVTQTQPDQGQASQPVGPLPSQLFSLSQQPGQPFEEVLSVTTNSITEQDKHTRFLGSMASMDKAFRISCKVIKPDNTEVLLEKRYTQADQGSDMNVISAGLVRYLGLKLHPLEEVGFKGLSMRTADHRESSLQDWVWIRVSVEGIARDIRCFVAPELLQTTTSGRTEHLSLILGLPWLYSVDVFISIRQSKIMVGDQATGETPRAVVGPELVFCKDHNLLMYPKAILAEAKGIRKHQAHVEDYDSSSESSDSEGDEDESDIEEIKRDF